jgi:hypothetical protein
VSTGRLVPIGLFTKPRLAWRSRVGTPAGPDRDVTIIDFRADKNDYLSYITRCDRRLTLIIFDDHLKGGLRDDA